MNTQKKKQNKLPSNLEYLALLCCAYLVAPAQDPIEIANPQVKTNQIKVEVIIILLCFFC